MQNFFFKKKIGQRVKWNTFSKTEIVIGDGVEGKREQGGQGKNIYTFECEEEIATLGLLSSLLALTLQKYF